MYSFTVSYTYPALDLDWRINYELPHVLDLGALFADESPALAGRHQEAQLQVHVAFRGSRPAKQNTELTSELPTRAPPKQIL